MRLLADALNAQQLCNRVRWLRPTCKPALCPLLVDHDRRGVRLGVVVANRLNHAPVARRALIGYDHAPHWVLPCAHTREPESYRHDFLSKATRLGDRA